MGTYTEFKFAARLKHDTPKEVIQFLQKVIVERNIGVENTFFKTEDVEKPKLNHPFFQTERWYMLFLSNNFFDDIITSQFKFLKNRWEITIHSEFKNYDDEIELFIDWIKPYVIGRKKKQYVGYYNVEGHDKNINIYIERFNNS